MIKIITIFIFCLFLNCYPEHIKYNTYISNTEEEIALINDSFDFFNQIVQCKAVTLNIKHEYKNHVLLNDFNSEIIFASSEYLCNESKNIYSYFFGCTAGFDKDITILRQNLVEHTNTCVYLYNNKNKNYEYNCDYRIIIVLHELGHAFGLEHSLNENDVMYVNANNVISEESLHRFYNQLLLTNLCKNDNFNYFLKKY